MYESIKKQREKFIASLRVNVSKYKANILLEDASKLDEKMLRRDWEQIGTDIKNNISTGIYEDLVKNLSADLQNVAKKVTKEECENGK